MRARYAFRATVRIDTPTGVHVEPETVEVRLYREAAAPGADGWLFFRDNCWRGSLADPAHFRELTEERLAVSVDTVAFAALETDEEYLDALREAIAADLTLFRADSVDEVLSKYLGSSIEVRDTLE